MSAADDNDKTNVRRPTKVGASAQSTIMTEAPVAPDNLSTSNNSRTSRQDTQLTQYSAAHNHSAGFAQARELVAKSLSGGMLLKKRFLLEDVLGEGGMGTVYKTKDLRKVEAEDPNPYIATKVLNSGFKDHPDAFVTLQQEAAKSQTLAHPNIVTVHDFDRDGDTLFMTMELLEGEPLDKILKARRNKGLPKQQVWTITRDLCAALAYAHQRQLIHADFKPGNIFINNEGHAKVLDFGIARAASKESQKHKFDAGQLGALTPAYATAEMVKDEPLSFSDDVYALACVIYEMLSGRHPYNNRSAYEALQQKQKPARLDQLTATEWKALSHALALEKSARTASIQELVRELFPRGGSLLIKITAGVAIASLLGAGWFAYRQHLNKLKTQQAVVAKIAAAQGCYERSDFSCAIEQSLVAVNLDPQNTVAAQLLQSAQIAKQNRANEETIVRLLQEATECLAQADAACVQVKTRDILALDARHQQAQALLENANRMAQTKAIQDLVQQAETCLDQEDIVCAELFSNKANEINSEHEASKMLTEKLANYQQSQRKQQQAQAQEIQRGLSEASQCFTRKDYRCTIQAATQVLQLEPANSQAVELKQSASLAQQQAKDLDQRVAKLLAEADSCMEKKNYSCAIAKAESALDLSPGHKQAATLKNRAQETQRKLKESGFTIK